MEASRLDASFERMLKHVVQVANELAGPQAFLVAGGVTEAVARFFQELPKHLLPRSVEVPALYLDIGDAELKSQIEAAASQLLDELACGFPCQVGEALVVDPGQIAAVRLRQGDCLAARRSAGFVALRVRRTKRGK